MSSYELGNAEPAVQVPKGGSNCANCKWVRPDGNSKSGSSCANKLYQKYNGSSEIPYAPDAFCSIWWEPKNSEATDENIREAFARTLARRK